MKAFVQNQYGSPDMLKLAEVEKPVPADSQVLIKIYAVSVNRSDWEALVGKPHYARIGGLFKPGKTSFFCDSASTLRQRLSDTATHPSIALTKSMKHYS